MQLVQRVLTGSVLLLIVALTPERAAAEPVPVPVGSVPSADGTCAPGWESTVFASARGSVVRITDGGGWGAGFVWKTPRQIVTAWHVVDSARSYEITFGDGSKGRARVVAGDRASDLGILELEGDAPALTPLELGDPASLPLGAPVIAIGHPLASDRADTREEGLRTWTVTRGVLGARNEHQIQVDAALNPGNSGGPILDCTGRVLGVASHVAGSLGFASAPKEILALDAARKTPGLSLAPSGFRFRAGLSARASDFTSFGPLAEIDIAFAGKVHLMVRATGLVNVTSTVDGNRVVTSRSGFHAFAGAGYELRMWRAVRILPHVGAARYGYRENALTFAEGRAGEASRSVTSIRLTPGLAVTAHHLMLDYKMEVDFGAIGDSAHLFSGSIAFF